MYSSWKCFRHQLHRQLGDAPTPFLWISISLAREFRRRTAGRRGGSGGGVSRQAVYIRLEVGAFDARLWEAAQGWMDIYRPQTSIMRRNHCNSFCTFFVSPLTVLDKSDLQLEHLSLSEAFRSSVS